MGMRLTGAASPYGAGRVLYDLWEGIDGILWTNSMNAPNAINLAGLPQFYTASVGRIFAANTPGAAFIPAATGVPYNLVRYTSAAGPVAQSATDWEIPWYRDLGGPMTPANARPALRWTWEAPIRVPTPGTSAVEFGQSGSQGLTIISLVPGVAWRSTPGIAGGAWQVVRRLLNGGAATVEFTSSLVPSTTAFDVMGLRYTEGVTPRIECLINGAPVFTIEGQAEMPEAAAGSIAPFMAVGAPIGTVAERLGAHVKVELA